MSKSDDFDLIVVGNGAIAMSSALTLAVENPDIRIALIGPHERPGAGSVASGAMLASFAEAEKGMLDNKYGVARFDMSRKASDMWPEWPEKINRLAGNDDFRINFGTYVIQNAAGDELDDENYDEILQLLRRFKEPHTEMDYREIPGLQAESQKRALKAVLIPREGSFSSGQLLATLDLALSRQKNIHVINDTATGIKIADGARKSIQTQSEKTYSSPRILLAAGAKTQELIQQIPGLAPKIPRLVYGVGTGVVLEAKTPIPQTCVRTVNRGMACGVHYVPYSRTRCYIGASNFTTPVPEYSPRMSSLYSLLQGSMEQLCTNFYKAEVVQIRCGHRPTTIDTFPLLGGTSIEGLTILSGTKRDGVHLSPLIAKSFAGEFQGEAPLYDNLFLPERDFIHTMTRAEGIEKAVRHMRSGAFQHELRLPKNGWDPLIQDMLRKRVEEVYQMCGVQNFGIPVEMLDMYRYGHTGRPEYAPKK